MKTIEEYSTIEELTNDFNNWFGWLLTNFDIEKGRNCKQGNSIEEDFTEDKIEMMLAITAWQFDDDELVNLNKLNLVYWYCVRLLYLNDSNNDYFYLEAVFDFLDQLTPFKV